MLAVQQLGLLDKFMHNPWATPWGWAVWRAMWDAIASEWTGQDCHLGKLMQHHGCVEMVPLVARCNNIGEFGVNKGRAGSVEHIHRRSIASSLFSNLDACRYTNLERGNAYPIVVLMSN